MGDDDIGQRRLQDYDVDIGPAPVEDPSPSCERCGTELDEEAEPWCPRSETEQKAEIFDTARGRNPGYICNDCQKLEWYLAVRHTRLTDRVDVVGSVAVFCECQSDDEVDVQPVRRGDSPTDRACSRCGSRSVVIEVLPPDGIGWEPGDEPP